MNNLKAILEKPLTDLHRKITYMPYTIVKVNRVIEMGWIEVEVDDTEYILEPSMFHLISPEE